MCEGIVIAGGAVAAVALSVRFSEQVNREDEALFFLGSLLLYVLFDLFRIPYREQVISLGFPVILFALLSSRENGPLIAAEIVLLGSLCSDSLYRLFVRHNLLPRFDRVLFYAAHHALAALAAMAAFDLVRGGQVISQPLEMEAFDLLEDPNYILAIVVYMAAYSLVSWVLVALHDQAIRNLQLPEDEEQLPRVHPFGNVVLMAPVPVALSVFVFTLKGPSRLILSLVFPALFLAFLVIARSYAAIEQETLSRRSREKVRQLLLGLTRLDKDLLVLVSTLANHLLKAPGHLGIAIYSASVDGGTLWLRGERDLDGKVHVYPVGDTSHTETGLQPGVVADTNSGTGELRWPRRVEPGQGALGLVVEGRLAQSGLTIQVTSPDTTVDPVLPAGTAYLYLPLQHAGEVVGLLALARLQRRFTRPDIDRLTPLTAELSQSLIAIQRVEKQIQDLYGRVEEYVADPMAVKQALENLVARGITRMYDILAMIPDYAFQKHFSETLDAFAEGRARNRFSTLDDKDLAAIYNEVRGREVSGMPQLDSSILGELRTVASSLSIAFSFQQHVSDRDRSEEYVPLYRVCRDALGAKTIREIAGQRSKVEDVLGKLARLEATVGVPLQVDSTLRRLCAVITDLEQSELADRTDLRRGRLKDALAELDTIEQTAKGLEAPLRLIFFNWVARWKRVILAALTAAGVGEAELDLALRSKQSLPLELVNVVLQVRNVGGGVATRVVAKLIPNVGYEVVGESGRSLGALQTDKIKEAEFVIKPQEMNSLRLVFRVNYWDSQGTQSRALEFADQLLLQGELPTYRQVDSPFVVGLPLLMGSPLFFGRDDIFEFIRQNVASGGRRGPQVLVLVGERRVGKTSIARQLPLRLQHEGYIHVYFDAQSVVDRGQFLLTLAACIAESLEDKGIAIGYPTSEEFLTSPGYAFEHRFLPRLWECLGERKLLVAVDEYETLQRRVDSKKEDPDVFEYLRSLIQHSQRMAFIFLGSQQMQELTFDYWHVLFNIAKHKTVGLLSQAEARRLIVEPIQEEIVYDELAVKEILRGTGRHPYFLQMVCDKLVEICNESQVSYVTIQQVREALRGVIETGMSHLEWLWNSTSPQEQVVLAGLAECLWEGELGTAETIARRVQRAGQVLEMGEAHRVLGRLVERQILRRPSEDTEFCEFAASLYDTWVRSKHPLAQQMTDMVSE